jgi:predicted lipoprotein with Yx(FWY)xxD motif
VSPPEGGTTTRADRRLTLLLAAGAVVAIVVLVLALISRSSGDEKSSPKQAGGTVHVATSKYGPILVNAQGRTLYLFIPDTKGKSTCYHGCAKVWPPLHPSASTHAGAGVSPEELTQVRRDDGTQQVVYHHHPLYTMTADTRPGQTEGQAFLGTWFVVSPHGNAITGGVKPSSGGY